MANKVKELSTVTEEAKSVAKHWSAKQDEIKSDISKLSNHVSDGYEYRDIDCTIEYNQPSEGMKTLIRADNNHAIIEKMEHWEHNLFTQAADVTSDDLNVLENTALKNPDTSVRRQTRKSKKKDDILTDIETENFDI